MEISKHTPCYPPYDFLIGRTEASRDLLFGDGQTDWIMSFDMLSNITNEWPIPGISFIIMSSNWSPMGTCQLPLASGVLPP